MIYWTMAAMLWMASPIATDFNASHFDESQVVSSDNVLASLAHPAIDQYAQSTHVCRASCINGTRAVQCSYAARCVAYCDIGGNPVAYCAM
jgi:hypothetical protein